MTRLDPSALAQYQQQGVLVPDLKLPATLIARMSKAIDSLHARHPETDLDFVPSPHVPNFVPGLIEYQPWLEFASIPSVLDVVEQLTGPDFLMWGSALFGKPAVRGKETPWHLDGEYWPIRPLASYTVWIAIDDATPSNGKKSGSEPNFESVSGRRS